MLSSIPVTSLLEDFLFKNVRFHLPLSRLSVLLSSFHPLQFHLLVHVARVDKGFECAFEILF